MAIVHPEGAPSWFELGTTDQAAAEAFYTGLFGWSVRRVPLPDGSHYTLFARGEHEVGACYGLMPEQGAAGVPSHWGVYFKVADCDAAVARVRAGGGGVFCEPFEVMEHLRMATVADPEGAAFSLQQPRAHPGVGVWGEPDTVFWVELACRDLARAEAFYREVFDWRSEPFQGGPSPYRVLSVAEREAGFGGLLQMDPDWGALPAHWSIYLHVVDVDACAARAQALGGKVSVPAFDVSGVGRIARIDDPSGAGFYVMMPAIPA